MKATVRVMKATLRVMKAAARVMKAAARVMNHRFSRQRSALHSARNA
jgi:hypothetical protein